MHSFPKDKLLRLLFTLGCIHGALGCNDESPPSPPKSTSSNPSSRPDPEENQAGDADADGDGGSGDDAATTDDGDPSDATGKVDGAGDGEDQAKEPTSFKRTAADLGDEATKQAMQQCMAQGNAFDRFSETTGTCVKQVFLAKLDCNLEGIRAILTPNQRTQFEAALEGKYKDWLVDQCIDCPKGGQETLCKNSDGDGQTGTKILFVKQELTQIKGISMVLPARPWQETTAP